MKIFNSVSDLAASKLTANQIVKVKGVGDYQIKDSGAGITLANSKIAVPQASGTAVNVKQFGAVGDGVTDDTAAIQAALTYCSSSGQKLVFPEGIYNTDSALTMGNHDLEMVGYIKYTGASAITVLTISASNRNIDLLVKNDATDWSSESLVGVSISGNSNNINLKNITGFGIGVRFGVSAPFAYNTVKTQYIAQNKVGLELKNTDSASYVNQNTFIGGRVSCQTDATINGISRYGVRVTSAGTYRNNNNVFYNLSFELKASATTGGAEAIPILMERGRVNIFNGCRCEDGVTSGVTAVKESNDSYNNSYDFAYCESAARGITYSSSSYHGSIFTEALFRSSFGVLNNIAFDSGDLPKLASQYSPTAVCIDGLHVQSSGLGTPQLALTGITINSDNIDIPTTAGFGTYIKLHNTKRFKVVMNLKGGDARVHVACFDSAGTLLTSGDAGHPYVVGTETLGMSWTTNYGGCYRSSADTTDEQTFSITSNDVAYINLLIVGGASSAELISFQVFADNTTSTYLGTLELRVRERFGSAAPTTGTWSQGDVVWDFTPSASSFMGWVCVTGGTPGTWKTFGAISA